MKETGFVTKSVLKFRYFSPQLFWLWHSIGNCAQRWYIKIVWGDWIWFLMISISGICSVVIYKKMQKMKKRLVFILKIMYNRDVCNLWDYMPSPQKRTKEVTPWQQPNLKPHRRRIRFSRRALRPYRHGVGATGLTFWRFSYRLC